MLIDQSNTGIFSIEVPFSQMSLACVKLTKPSLNRKQASKLGMMVHACKPDIGGEGPGNSHFHVHTHLTHIHS